MEKDEEQLSNGQKFLKDWFVGILVCIYFLVLIYKPELVRGNDFLEFGVIAGLSYVLINSAKNWKRFK
jgi:hypothetical protein